MRNITRNENPVVMEYWWNKGDNLISIRFLKQHWKSLQWKSNGAEKGKDSCYDLNIHFLGIFFSYLPRRQAKTVTTLET